MLQNVIQSNSKQVPKQVPTWQATKRVLLSSNFGEVGESRSFRNNQLINLHSVGRTTDRSGVH